MCFHWFAPNQKGYKCFSPTTKRLHVSIDVSFLENQPFFDNNSLQGKIRTSEDNFLADPIPNTILHSISPADTNAEDIENNKDVTYQILLK